MSMTRTPDIKRVNSVHPMTLKGKISIMMNKLVFLILKIKSQNFSIKVVYPGPFIKWYANLSSDWVAEGNVFLKICCLSMHR